MFLICVCFTLGGFLCFGIYLYFVFFGFAFDFVGFLVVGGFGLIIVWALVCCLVRLFVVAFSCRLYLLVCGSWLLVVLVVYECLQLWVCVVDCIYCLLFS